MGEIAKRKKVLLRDPVSPTFLYLLDICRITAASVLVMNKHTEPRKQNLLEVGFSLAMKLVKPLIKARSNPVFLNLFPIAAYF